MIKNIALIIIYLASATCGQLLVKLGSSKTQLTLQGGMLNITSSWQMLCGLGLYIISFVLFVIILGKYNLSFIIPLLSGVSYVIIMILAATVLHEKVYTSQVFGVAAILIGIVLMNIKVGR